MNKKNKGLNAEIEPISEDTANELEKVLKGAHSFRNYIIFHFSLKTLQIKLVYESERYTKYCCNFVFATFITRWYWKRKMNKQSDIVKKTIKDIENVKAIYEKDEFHRQREIEGESKCKTQCEHCVDYYKDIDEDNF